MVGCFSPVVVVADAEVRISQDPVTKEISIVSCAVSTDLKAKKGKTSSKADAEASSNGEKDTEAEVAIGVEVDAAAAAAETEGDEFVSVGCVTKWQGWFE